MLFKRPMKFEELVNRVYPRKRNVNPNLLSHFGQVRLNKITSLMIEGYKAHRLQTVKPSSVNREIAIIKHCFSQGMLWGLTDRQPCRGVKLLKETPKDRWLTYAEEALILSQSPDWLKPIILIDINTGLRLSELMSLTWEDVDLDRRALTVRKSKNGEIRVIPLNSQTHQTLRGIKLGGTNGKVFPFSASFVSHTFRRTCDKVGLTDVTFHSLRHSFASRLAQHNIDVLAIQKLMGHKSISMTQRYSHHTVDSLKPDVEQLISVNVSNLAHVAQW
jgi:integrase